MNRSLCYVAAPFGAPTTELRRLNTERAEFVGRLAMLEGLAPVVVHSGIMHGVYGDDTNEEERAAGMEATERILILIARDPTSVIWFLRRDDGTLSPGCIAELATWRKVRPSNGRDPGLTWEGYQPHAEAHGLDPRWHWLDVEHRAATAALGGV